jgi:transitional endoplasmic reticulum ATPase
LGLTPPKGILLYGPPGCSKTTLVKAVAHATQANFLALSGAQIYSPYLGDAEAAIRDLFKKARLGAPAILFFDEIEAIVGKRSFGDSSASSAEGVQERVLATLLNEMDGIEQSNDLLIIVSENSRGNNFSRQQRIGLIWWMLRL